MMQIDFSQIIFTTTDMALNGSKDTERHEE